MSGPRLCALLTCHNRRELTLTLLRSLFAQEGQDAYKLSVTLVDAGSTDGTRDACRSEFPGITIVPAGPDVYWNQGMRLALQNCPDGDAHLWLNDDVTLDPDAVMRLLRCSDALGSPAIVVGGLLDPQTGRSSYGGFERVYRFALKFRSVPPHPDSPRPIDTFNGNLVLIPRAVFQALGSLSPAYSHQFGDVDYGLRARRSGFPVYLAPGHFGFCAENPGADPFAGSLADPSKSTLEKLRALGSPKGLPPGEMWRFAREHAPLLAPLLWMHAYAKLLARLAVGSLR